MRYSKDRLDFIQKIELLFLHKRLEKSCKYNDRFFNGTVVNFNIAVVNFIITVVIFIITVVIFIVTAVIFNTTVVQKK